MVSQTVIYGLVLEGIISILIPVIAFVYMKKTYKTISLRPIVVGVFIFVIFSQILESGLNAYILQGNKTTAEIIKYPYWFALYASFAAGIFEEVGRFIGFTLFLKENRERKDGLAYGLGHGGIEAVLVGVTFSIQNIIYGSFINSGKFDAVFGVKASPELVAQIKNSVLSLTYAGTLLGGVERIAAFIIQLALSLLVLYAVNTKQFRYVLLAIFLHAGIDYVAVLHRATGLSLYIVEAFLIVLAIGAFLFVRKSNDWWHHSQDSSKVH